MARTVDPERYAARRLQIIDAAVTRFAADGYVGATTASICRTAGIGSGTFFHYFPTKADVLLGVLAEGTEETRAWFAAQDGRDDPLAVLRDWVRRSVDELADPRLAGFVRAVGAVMTEPAVAAALARDEQVQQDGLERWVDRARSGGQVRQDRSAAELAAWLALVLDGFVARLAGDDWFTAHGQGDMLLETVDRLLAPR